MRKLPLRLIDALLALPVLGLAFIWAVVLMIIGRLFHRRRSPNAAQVLLTLTTGSTAVIAKRNIASVYDASTLNGFFKHCIFLFYLSDCSRVTAYSNAITLIDFRHSFGDQLKKWGFPLCSHLIQEMTFLHDTRRLIRSKAVTVMQANDPYIQGAHAWLLSQWTGVPYVIRVVCDYDHYHEKFGRLAFPVLRSRALENNIERWVMKRADGVIPWTQNYMRYALRKNAVPEKTVIVPTLTDPRYFNAPENGAPPEAPFDLGKRQVLLYLGRISWDKYCLDLVDCMAEVVKTFPDAMLVILGDGELREQFLQKATAQNLQSHIFLAGMQSVENIIAWGRIARVMLAPHAGYSLVELGAVGIPVVAYDYEWHSEVVRDGETGFIVAFRNPLAMAQAACRILGDRALGQRMTQQIRLVVRNEHAPEIVERKMRDFFRRLLETAR